MAESLYGVGAEQKAIWVYLEQNRGVMAGVSLELLAKARLMADEAGWKLVGFLAGRQIASLATLAISHGADEVIMAEHALLEMFTADAYTLVAFAVHPHR